MRNWDLREFRVRGNLPYPIWQVRVPIWRVITPIQGLPHPIKQVVPLMSHIPSYPPHYFHLHPSSLSFPSSTLPSLKNTELSHPSSSLYGMIMSRHCVKHTPSTAYTKYRIHQLQHTPTTAYTNYRIHQLQHMPNIVCLPFILMITRWPLNVASASGMPLYMIESH